jgi:PASTA domain-containing protein
MNGSLVSQIASSLIVVALSVGCSTDDDADTAAVDDTTTTTASDGTTMAPATAPTSATTTTTAAAASQALMPDIACGTNLQDAQDRVQEAGVFYSRSEDATGQGRSQVLDRNWTVIRQSPPPGTPIAEGDPVFQVVKNEEFTGC